MIKQNKRYGGKNEWLREITPGQIIWKEEGLNHPVYLELTLRVKFFYSDGVDCPVVGTDKSGLSWVMSPEKHITQLITQLLENGLRCCLQVKKLRLDELHNLFSGTITY